MVRDRGIMSAIPLNLQQKRYKPESVPSTIKIKAVAETSNTNVARR